MRGLRRRTPFAAVATVCLVALALPQPCEARGEGGFLRDWVVCGPLEGTQLGRPALEEDFAAYPGLFTLGRVCLPVQLPPSGRLDLRTLFPRTRNGTALLHTFFEVPADGCYHLRIGSDDAVRVEIDGRVVHTNDVIRHWTADEDRVKVVLAKGWHRMLVRVVEYGGAWMASVRFADKSDRPLDLKHQATVPEPLRALCRLDESVPPEERAKVTAYLAGEVERLLADLEAEKKRLAASPEGYVTFAEYEGARDLGLGFFDALMRLWSEEGRETWNREAAREACRAAVAAASGFSDRLAAETMEIASAIETGRNVWERLGSARLTREAFAAANLKIAGVLARSRQLATRVAQERILMARLENDIRNWRQRDVTVRVVDAEGGAVENADVEIVQTRHGFLFGCNLFAFGRWGDDERNLLYEKRFRRLFNFATVPLYWSSLEPRRGHWKFGALEPTVEWARKNRILIRGHPLLWNETLPRWLKGVKSDEVSPAVKEHVQRTVERYRDSVGWWDVVHEPGPDVRLGDRTLDPAEPFRWVAEMNPGGRLVLNHNDVDILAHVGKGLRASNVPIDAVGIEAHQHTGVWPMELVGRTLDQAASVGLPVHVSGVTILGGPEGEADQAEAVRRFYTVAFAHPRVVSITWWDLSDRFAWKNAPAGLVRADLSPKPAYKALARLINRLWRTDAAGRTDQDGRTTVRAFFGDYRITARAGRRKRTVTAHLDREGPREVEVVLPAGK